MIKVGQYVSNMQASAFPTGFTQTLYDVNVVCRPHPRWAWRTNPTLLLDELRYGFGTQTPASRPPREPETVVGGRSGLLQDQFVDSEGSNNSDIRAFAQDALRDRIVRSLRKP
jgi:hypothetical protein